MPTLESLIDLQSAEFAANRDAMQLMVDGFREIETKVIDLSLIHISEPTRPY